jgi:hypothetical protein
VKYVNAAVPSPKAVESSVMLRNAPALFPEVVVWYRTDPVGAEITFAVTVIVSVVAADAAKTAVTGRLATTPGRIAGIVPAVRDETALLAVALAGATEVRTPRPKAATATSATRLKVVFVDICFLSISRVREFPDLGFG